MCTTFGQPFICHKQGGRTYHLKQSTLHTCQTSTCILKQGNIYVQKVTSQYVKQGITASLILLQILFQPNPSLKSTKLNTHACLATIYSKLTSPVFCCYLVRGFKSKILKICYLIWTKTNQIKCIKLQNQISPIDLLMLNRW